MMRFAKALYVGLCVEAFFSIAYRGTFLLTHRLLLAWTAAALVLLFAAVSFRFREAFLDRLWAMLPLRWMHSKGWLPFCLAVGVLLRLAWALSFPVILKSDGAAYFGIAQKMAEHSYTGVFWPPGLPLLLAPMVLALGPSPWVSVFVALLLFAGTCTVSWLLARELAGRTAAAIAAAVLAVWPGYLTTIGINSKEGVIALALPAAMLLYLKAFDRKKTRWLFLTCAGFLVGYAILTQPGCLLFAGLILILELGRGSGLVSGVGRTVVFGLAALAVILPWSLRNVHVAHRFVLISVNGGSVFYRANNPLANAAYSPEGEIHLPADIYEADRVGYREGKKWIAHHPVGFLVLAVRKQVGYLGDDGIGVYETLERDARPSAALYAGAKAICSAYWLALWCVLLMGVSRLFQRASTWRWYGCCFLPVVYQWTIDSVFESGSRHHLVDVGFLAVLAGVAIGSYEEGSTKHVAGTSSDDAFRA